MYYSLESFIRFCDDMMIAEESVFTTIKNGLIKLFTNLINFLERQIGKMKDSKVKNTLLRLLSRAKNGLTKSKNIKEGDDKVVEELKQDAEEIKQEAEVIIEEKKQEEKKTVKKK